MGSIGTTTSHTRHRDRLAELYVTIATGWSDTMPIADASKTSKTLESLVPRKDLWLLSYSPPIRYSKLIQRGEFTAQQAASCVEDIPRTRRFIQDIIASTKKHLISKSGEIVVVDAGCGPFAFLGLCALLQSPERIKLYCVEINGASVALAKKVIKKLGLEDRVIFLPVDVKQLTADSFHGAPIDLVISETFDSGMEKERGPEILFHLGKFLAPDGIMIPQAYGFTIVSTLQGQRTHHHHVLHDARLPEVKKVHRTIALANVAAQDRIAGTISVATELHFNNDDIAPLLPTHSSPITQPLHLACLKGRAKSNNPHIEISSHIQPHLEGGAIAWRMRGHDGIAASVRSSYSPHRIDR